MASYIALNYWELAAASVFVFMNAGLSVIFRLRVHRSLLVAAIRMAVQLALVGLVLTTLFSVVSPLWTGLAALGMVLFAGHEAAQRQERRLSGWWSYGLGTGCMMMASVLVTVFALLIAVRPNPWYDPRYAIPAPRDDFRQLHDRHCLGSRHPDDEPRQPPCKCGSSAHARRYQTGGGGSSNARGAP